MPQAFCVKCKKKVEIVNPTNKVSLSKRHMISGSCPYCKTKVNIFVSSKKQNA